MANKISRLQITIIFLSLFVAMSVGIFVSQHMHAKKKIDASQFAGTLLNEPRSIRQFALLGTDNKPFTNASLQGHWTMMFFGFTQCGSVCPTIMAELGKMYRILEEKNIKPLPNVVMISVDPQRDSLAKLKHYVEAFDVHFAGARGSEEAIKALTQEMGIAYLKVMRNSAEKMEDYDIEHTGTVMLFDPNGHLVEFFTSPQEAEKLAKDYMLLAS